MSFQNSMSEKVYTLLGSATTSVSFYNDIAPEAADYPYAVYTIGESFTQNQIETFMLNINLWDKNYDATDINNWVDAIDDTFNRTYYSTGGYGYQIDRVNILNLPAEGEFKGKELKYSIRVTRRNT